MQGNPSYGQPQQAAQGNNTQQSGYGQPQQAAQAGGNPAQQANAIPEIDINEEDIVF